MDIRKVPKDDNAVWDMICEGRVKGCFQIESHLGKIWCKKVKPRKIRELSDVIAVIRPGILNSTLDGKNMAQHYVDRKFGKEEIPSLHPLIDPILEPTYGIIVYQEQIISIAKILARFNGREADSLRKNISKKRAKELAALKDKFINGCISNEVDKELAERIFNNIEASNRYSFNACLSPDTVIETKTGDFISIGEVKIGESIKTPNGYANIVNKYNNGIKELYEVKFNNGSSIKCTLLHKFQCESGEIKSLEEILISGENIVVDD